MGLTSTSAVSGTPVLELSNLRVSRGGRTIVKDVDLVINEGEFLGLVGPNGSGKTSMMLAILGILKSSKGSIKIYGKSNKSRDIIGKIAWVSQAAANLPRNVKITVRELISLGSVNQRNMLLPLNKYARQKVEEIIEMVGLKDCAGSDVGSLSGGQKQRAVIGRALASNAEFILLDEPLVGIDRNARNSLLKLLDNLCHEQNKTVLMISHDLAAIQQTAHRVIYLEETIRFDGTPSEFPDLASLAGLRGIKQVHEHGHSHHHHDSNCDHEEEI